MNSNAYLSLARKSSILITITIILSIEIYNSYSPKVQMLTGARQVVGRYLISENFPEYTEDNLYRVIDVVIASNLENGENSGLDDKKLLYSPISSNSFSNLFSFQLILE